MNNTLISSTNTNYFDETSDSFMNDPRIKEVLVPVILGIEWCSEFKFKDECQASDVKGISLIYQNENNYKIALIDDNCNIVYSNIYNYFYNDKHNYSSFHYFHNDKHNCSSFHNFYTLETVIHEVIRLNDINLKYPLIQKHLKELIEPFIADLRIKKLLAFSFNNYTEYSSIFYFKCGNTEIDNVNCILTSKEDYFEINIKDTKYGNKYNHICNTLEEVIQGVINFKGIYEEEMISVLHSSNYGGWNISAEAISLYFTRINKEYDDNLISDEISFRSDPILVSIFEELGDAFNGSYCKL